EDFSPGHTAGQRTPCRWLYGPRTLFCYHAASRSAGGELSMSATFLDVRDLRKRYGDTVALDGVSFTVAGGEIFGLLGPNGAGKTTLLSILSCLLQANAGEAFLLGRVLSPDDREL